MVYNIEKPPTDLERGFLLGKQRRDKFYEQRADTKARVDTFTGDERRTSYGLAVIEQNSFAEDLPRVNSVSSVDNLRQIVSDLQELRIFASHEREV